MIGGWGAAHTAAQVLRFKLGRMIEKLSFFLVVKAERNHACLREEFGRKHAEECQTGRLFAAGL